MGYTYIFRVQKVWKCTLIAAVLIVSFHLIFISRGIFQLSREERIIAKKLNWLANNASVAPPMHCNREAVSIDT
jgi:cell division protein FtsL